jgi:hypothetical protein
LVNGLLRLCFDDLRDECFFTDLASSFLRHLVQVPLLVTTTFKDPLSHGCFPGHVHIC